VALCVLPKSVSLLLLTSLSRVYSKTHYRTNINDIILSFFDDTFWGGTACSSTALKTLQNEYKLYPIFCSFGTPFLRGQHAPQPRQKTAQHESDYFRFIFIPFPSLFLVSGRLFLADNMLLNYGQTVQNE